jgi:hypothetical protein
MKTKAKSLMSKEFLLAATTVVVLALKAFFGLTLPQEATQNIVLKVAAYIVGQDALSTADAVAV